MTKSEIIKRVDEMIIGRNATRNKKIIISLFVDGETYSKVAEKFELTERQVHNISRKWRAVISE